MVNAHLVLVYRVNQRSHVTKITKVKRNIMQFIGGKFNHCDNFISIVIGSCTLGIKTPFQLTTLNVMGAPSDLFDVFYHGKFQSHPPNTYKNLVAKGSFTGTMMVKVPHVTL